MGEMKARSQLAVFQPWSHPDYGGVDASVGVLANREAGTGLCRLISSMPGPVRPFRTFGAIHFLRPVSFFRTIDSV